jgi:hypothetical protein
MNSVRAAIYTTRSITSLAKNLIARHCVCAGTCGLFKPDLMGRPFADASWLGVFSVNGLRIAACYCHCRYEAIA